MGEVRCKQSSEKEQTSEGRDACLSYPPMLQSIPLSSLSAVYTHEGRGGMGGGHGEKYWILRRTCLQCLEVCLVFLPCAHQSTNQPSANQPMNATNATKW